MTYKNKNLWRWLLLLVLSIFLTACSTTDHLPEDDKLYIGIDKIVYQDSPYEREKLMKKDSVGVIASIGGAVKNMENLFSAGDAKKTGETVDLSVKPYSLMTKEEKKKMKLAFEEEQKDFSKAQTEVEAVLAFPPNNALFGSSSLRSPLQFGLWNYNKFADAKGAFGKWMFKHFSSDPVLLSEASPEMRSRVATNTLHNYGYLKGQVKYTLPEQKHPKKAKVAYQVYAGPIWRLDSIAYMKFPQHADSLLKATSRMRLLHKGDAFNVVNLANEQMRIERLFRENGYFYYTAPYTIYRADTTQRAGKVQLQISPSSERPARVRHQWYIGDVNVSVRNNEKELLDQNKKILYYTFAYFGKKLPLKVPMWFRSVQHRKGHIYRQSDEEYTLGKLNSLDVFSQLDINYVPRDTTPQCDTLDLYISAVMDKLYDSSFEMNAVFKSNQQVGPGISFGLSKRNAFGGGEKVGFKLFGSYEWQTGAGRAGGNSLLNSYELGTELTFEMPRFVCPYLGKRYFRFPSTTTYAINADWRNRAGFFNMVTLGANMTYKWNKYSTSHHELTLLALDFDKMLHTTTSFDSIMNANPALSISMRDQFIPSLSYTFTYTSAKYHRNPIWLQVSAKESGNLVSGIYSACGKSWKSKDKELFGNPFAQYIKLTTELHHNIKLGSRMNLASRVFAGAIYSYGNSLRAPYADQFYVGGANSIRGFTVRTIGPGSYRSQDSKYAYIDQTGDFKLEANLELRAKLFGSLHGAVFMDAGNVWLLRDDAQRPGAKLCGENMKKIAVGTGLGIRYDLDFLVLRFDVGVPLHAPYETGKSGWYNIHKFGKSLAYHFAIGYPF